MSNTPNEARVGCPMCHLNAKPSYEHVPPESCHNDRPVRTFELMRVLENPNDKGWVQQRGHGYGDKLCEACNNFLGSKYNRAFSDWEKALYRAKTISGIRIIKTCYPLRVIKGVLGLFLSCNSDVADWDGIRAFLLDPRARGLPEPFRLFGFCRQGPIQRATGTVGLISFGETFIMSEVHTEAAGYVLSLDGQRWSPSWEDLTEFGTFEYDEAVDVKVFLQPLVCATHLPFDYRNDLMVARGAEPPPMLLGLSGGKSRAFHPRDEHPGPIGPGPGRWQ